MNDSAEIENLVTLIIRWDMIYEKELMVENVVTNQRETHQGFCWACTHK